MVSSPSKTKILEVSNVHLSYDNNVILDNINLTLYQGEIVTIIGPNGSGKTSFAKIILKLLKPNQGTICYQDDLTIGYMPQKINIERLMPITVGQFLSLTEAKDLAARIEYLADLISIKSLLNKQIYELSGGELQRVILAKSLIAKPKLLVLDEPVQGVDVNGQAEFYQLIEKIRDEDNTTILMISHDLFMVMRATNHVICLNHHICCEGKASDISKHSEYLRLFGEQNARMIAAYHHHHDHKH